MSSSADDFKTGFRRHAAGVAIVATSTPEGLVGTTLSSVASVSADPAVLSFSMARTSGTAATIVEAERVSVFTLASTHEGLAAAFAGPPEGRFTDEQGWTVDADGTPTLAGATAAFHGRVAQVIPAGGSWLVVVEVDDVRLGDEDDPLVYHDRAYWALGRIRSHVA